LKDVKETKNKEKKGTGSGLKIEEIIHGFKSNPILNNQGSPK
jgi:hypothetical protein